MKMTRYSVRQIASKGIASSKQFIMVSFKLRWTLPIVQRVRVLLCCLFLYPDVRLRFSQGAEKKNSSLKNSMTSGNAIVKRKQSASVCVSWSGSLLP